MILVTGARGQIGSDLVTVLRERHGPTRVLATDLREPAARNGLPYEIFDVTDRQRLDDLVAHYQVDTLIHLASLLSATGEQQPDLCWDVNVGSLRNILDVAVERGLKVFWPSSIAVFGPHTPRHHTPQTTIEDPSTMYGITKVTGELLCRYYARRYGVDVRSVRLPGIISYTTPPGGGTTDYAVEIFYEALQRGTYTCFVRPDTRLPMMYMPDAVKAILDIMEAESSAIKVRSSYNIAAVSFSAEELVAEIQKNLPGFVCRYEPDYRQAIADTWPTEIDDSRARNDWGWQHACGLSFMVEDMLEKLSERMGKASTSVPP